ncbi:MAG: transcription termination/antitermination protein NusG [Gemmataceae bacterium]
MPLLSLEPFIFPNNLFESSELEPDATWWVLHTKPRQEKAVARHLYQAQVPFYLPLLERRNIIRGRVMSSFNPLFCSYVFLRGLPEQRIEALNTKRLVRTIDVHDQQALIHDLSNLHRMIAAGLPVTPEDHLYPGVKVRIRSGPLEGLEGKIIREASKARFVVQVDFIQRGASIVLDEFMLAAISESEG